MPIPFGAAPPLAVTYRPVSTLRPDPRNARTHSKHQINQLVAAIRQFGIINPVLADPEGRIIAGHGRLMAAKAVGLTEVPAIHIHGLSEAQKRALRIADYKIALRAGWDIDILKSELAEVGSLDLDFDISVAGFSTGELDVILNGRADPDDEVVPEPPDEAEFRAFLKQTLGVSAAVSPDGAVHFVCMDWRHNGCVGGGQGDLRRTSERLLVDQVQCRNGIALLLEA